MSIQRAICPVLAVVFVISGLRADDPAPNIHSAVTQAIADGGTVKTKCLGWGGERGQFTDTNSRGGILVGFDLGMRTWFDSEVITAVRPVYRGATGTNIVGKEYGSFVEGRKQPYRDGIVRVLQVRARAGYAVGAMNLRTGGGIDAMQLVYMRVSGDRLDPERTSKSTWVGNSKGGSEDSVSAGGMPVVGIFGNSERDRIHSLGLIRVQLPDPTPVKAKKVEPKPSDKPTEKPAVVKAAEKQPAPAPASRWTYRDPVRNFKFDLSAGWVRMLYVEQQQLQQKWPGLFELPESAYRPEKATLGESFIFMTTAKIRPGRSLEELGAELTAAGPYREATSNLRDLARTLSPGEVIVDRVRHRFFWRTKADVGKIETLHICHIGNECAVTLHCHAHEATFSAYLAAFIPVSDSFAFDSAQAYRPPVSAAVAWVSMAVFLGVSAVIFVPLAIFYGQKARTRHRRSRAKRDEPLRKQRPSETEKPDAPAVAKAFAPSTGIISSLPESTPLMALPVEPEEAQVMDTVLEAIQFTCFAERAYRVYVLPGEVYFIDAGAADARQYTRGGGTVGGALGALVGSVVDQEVKARTEKRRSELDRLTPDELFAMADGIKNYRVQPDEVWQAQIDAPGFWDSMGSAPEAVGFLKMGHQSRGELTFHFRELDDMRRAIDLLSQVFEETLSVNAILDKRKWKYVRPS